MANRSAKIAEVQRWLDGLNQDIESQNAPTASGLSPSDAVGVPGPDVEIAPAPPETSYGVDALKKQREHDQDRANRLADRDSRIERQNYQQKLADARAAQQEQDRLRKQELANRSEVEKTVRGIGGIASSLWGQGQRAWGRTRSRLETVPTPGDIWVPLALLLFFFLVLFPVNGHTRLMWLWMTITRNAQIGGALPQPTFNPLTPQPAPPPVTQQLLNFAGQSARLIRPPTTAPVTGHPPPVSVKPPVTVKGHAPQKHKPTSGPAPHGSGPDTASSILKGYTQYGSLLQGLE